MDHVARIKQEIHQTDQALRSLRTMRSARYVAERVRVFEARLKKDINGQIAAALADRAMLVAQLPQSVRLHRLIHRQLKTLLKRDTAGCV